MDDAILSTGAALPRPSLEPPTSGLVAALALGRGQKGQPAQLERTAKDFESILLYRLLEEMKNTIPQSGLLDGAATQQVQDIFWFYLAQDISARGGLGMWKELLKQMDAPAPAPAVAPGAAPASAASAGPQAQGSAPAGGGQW